MPDFVNGPELSRRLATAFRDGRHADLAVAFWGVGAADALGIQNNTDMTIRIVCNLLSGGTNPDEIKTLLERGADVRQLNDLHAKLGVIGGISFLGSSNMSTNGLGSEEALDGWREANIVYDNARPEIHALFEAFWTDAAEITEADLAAAALAWAARRRGDAAVAASQGERSLVEVMRTAPAQLDALNVRMVVYDTMTDPEELEIIGNAEEQARQQYGEAFEVYWDWESMRTEAANAYLVDYDWPARGRIARGALFRRDTDHFEDLEDEFPVAYEIDTIEGITFPAADRAAIREAFHPAFPK